jgi:VIT1/CCC1 family predicted Fe2+/Mn2+ transporter
VNLWNELWKRRDGPERLVSTGIAFVLVGSVSLLWDLVMSRDEIWTVTAVSFIAVGALLALVGYVMARRGRSSR